MRRRVGLVLVCAALAATLAARSATVPDAAPDRRSVTASALPGVLVTRQLLEAERLRVGDLISLSGQRSGADARRYQVVGVYEPTPDPMRLGAERLEVRLHLPDLLDLTPSADRETVDAVNVALVSPDGAREVARRLAAVVPGIAVVPTSDDDRRAAPFVVLERFHLAIAIVTVLASSVFLLALMLMLVEERRATAGVLRLIGFRRRRILEQVLAEGLALAVVGALLGVVLAAALQHAINLFFQWRYDTALVFVRITPGVAARSMAVSIPLGLAAIVTASWSLLRRDALSLTRR